MYAIIENGGKQYKVEKDQVVKFEKIKANVGDKVEFEVLLVSDENGVKVGSDAKSFKVVGEVLEQSKLKKIIVFKYKAKKNERKKQGHRQPFTAVKIESISAN
ncbi:MAG: 50S ribosomal protein L21 [Clostridia bacterium]|nr:50S ribosomal protein L21 [Clostridia bacterium]